MAVELKGFEAVENGADAVGTAAAILVSTPLMGSVVIAAEGGETDNPS